MYIRRGSTRHNTWTLEHNLYEEVMSRPDIKLVVVNKKGRSITLTQQEVATLWEFSAFVSSEDGYPVKIIHFPWHPLNL